MLTTVTYKDRLMGGIMGLLIGDALGVPVEFSTRFERKFDPVRGMRAYGTHCQPRGTWSDDGAMTLAHAHTFTYSGWQPETHLRAFCNWYRLGMFSAHDRVFDIGEGTKRSLHRFEKGVAPLEAGGGAEWDNGNGSLMRALPGACWWADAPDDIRRRGLSELSSLTHRHPRSQIACMYFGEIVRGILASRCLTEVLPAVAGMFSELIRQDHLIHFRDLVQTSCLDWAPEQVPNDSHVTASLAAACWCFQRHSRFDETVLAAVNLGGDTDTIAAIAGGLAGLRCGYSGLPKVWITTLPRTAWLVDLIDKFADACMEHRRFYAISE